MSILRWGVSEGDVSAQGHVQTEDQTRAVGARGEPVARAMNCHVGASSGGALVCAGEIKGTTIVVGVISCRQHQQVS